MFITYVLYNLAVNKLYIGQTSNIDERMKAHNQKHGQHFTSKFQGEWKLIYQESFSTRSEALLREKQLKSHQGREYIKQFIPG